MTTRSNGKKVAFVGFDDGFAAMEALANEGCQLLATLHLPGGSGHGIQRPGDRQGPAAADPLHHPKDHPPGPPVAQRQRLPAAALRSLLPQDTHRPDAAHGEYPPHLPAPGTGRLAHARDDPAGRKAGRRDVPQDRQRLRYRRHHLAAHVPPGRRRRPGNADGESLPADPPHGPRAALRFRPARTKTPSPRGPAKSTPPPPMPTSR